MERDLLSQFKSAREQVETCKTALVEANKAEDVTLKALVDYLEAKGASATGRYDGLGWAKLNPPRCFASYQKEQEEAVFAWLREHGQESSMKLTVHPSTFSQIVGEALREGTALPEGTTFYLKPQVRLYGGAE